MLLVIAFYHLLMAAVASDTDSDSLHCASMLYAYQSSATDNKQLVGADSNSYSIHLNVLLATAVRLSSAADSITAVDYNLCNYYFHWTMATSMITENK